MSNLETIKLILTVVSGVCWTIVYVEGIRVGFKDKSYAIPFYALTLNIAWELLIDVHDIVAEKLGQTVGWILALSSLLLTGFAIYLGRFLRWNSWDVLARPSVVFDIVDGLLHPASHSRTFAVTLIYGIILGFGYISLRVLQSSPVMPQATFQVKHNHH